MPQPTSIYPRDIATLGCPTCGHRPHGERWCFDDVEATDGWPMRCPCRNTTWLGTEPAREPWHPKPRPTVRIRITFDASQFIAAMQRVDAAAQRAGAAFARVAQEIAASMERER